jgi:septum formation protein
MPDKQTPVLRLASASPRRRQLLELIGVPHVVTPADIDETPGAEEHAPDYVCRLARQKAEAVWKLHTDLPVLGSDTTVAVGDDILGKPESQAECVAMLERLSGLTHQVHTAVTVISRAGTRVELSSTDVTFRTLSRAEIDAYWQSGEPQGKAGAYAIQGLGAVFVSRVVGSYTGVMGLPLFETAKLLRHHGIKVWNGVL